MKVDTPQQDTMIYIYGGRGGATVNFASYKYWEIIGELIFKGVERMEAYDAGKWAKRATVGEVKHLSHNVTMKVKSI